jgi:hypothetical protein
MTAEDTALRTALWAASDVIGPMPEGDLAAAAGLASPTAGLLRAIGRLAAITAARLRLLGPLLGDQRPPSLSAGVLAAAIGGHADGDRAGLLLQAVPAPTRAADLLAHHGLVAKAAGLLPGQADLLRDLSPLTGLLDRPGPRTTTRCEDLLDQLRSDPAARRAVILQFATPGTDAQAAWRGECLSQLRHADRAFVLDVYEAAFVYYGREHEIRARAAWLQVLSPGPPEPSRYRTTATWWRALAEIEASALNAITARSALTGPRRRIGTNLYRRVLQLEAA